MLTSALSANVSILKIGSVNFYGTGAIVHHYSITRGEATLFSDIHPFEHITKFLDSKGHGVTPLIGGGIELQNKLNFYIEPALVMIYSDRAVISTGIRVPL